MSNAMEVPDAYLDGDGVRLYGNDLLSKYGFDDGTVMLGWWWNQFGETIPKPEGFNLWSYDPDHRLLYHLVNDFLVPKIMGDVKLQFILTSHNPVRLESIDGISWAGDREFWKEPTVAITKDQIMDTYRKKVENRVELA